MTLKVAFRNFTRNRRRFLLLGLAVAAGFFVICIIQSLVAGISSQISIRGARYYGGQVMVLGYQKHPREMPKISDDGPILKAIARSGIRPAIVTHRTHNLDGLVFFNGETVRMRRVIGLDWSAEAPAIRQMEFISGDPDGMRDPRGVLISDVTAKRLGARVGDDVILQISREGGAIDTASLVVKAIFREVSIFGYYTIYMDRGVLNGVLGWDKNDCTLIGMYLQDFRKADEASARLLGSMNGLVSTFPPFRSQSDYDTARSADYAGTRYGTMTIQGFMSEIRTMLEALTLVSYGILVLVFIVITVGIMNIYRVMIYERTREIGTMRAIGVQKAQVRNLILTEAFFLSACSIIVGLVFSMLVLTVVSHFQLSGAAGFDIFLDRGHLSWVLNTDVTAFDAVLITLVTLLGALGPARAAQAIEPVVALRSE